LVHFDLASDKRGADYQRRIEKRGARNVAGVEVKTDLEKVVVDLLRVDTVLDGGRNLERDLSGACTLGGILPLKFYSNQARPTLTSHRRRGEEIKTRQ
jgi:hypothetical protein